MGLTFHNLIQFLKNSIVTADFAGKLQCNELSSSQVLVQLMAYRICGWGMTKFTP